MESHSQLEDEKVVEKLSLEQRLRKFLKYAWFNVKSKGSYWQAARQDGSVTESDRNEILMMKVVLNDIKVDQNHTFPEMINFFDMRNHLKHPLCKAIVSEVELALKESQMWTGDPDYWMLPESLKELQTFVLKVQAIFDQDNVLQKTNGENFILLDSKEVPIGNFFGKNQGVIERMNSGIQGFEDWIRRYHQHMPDPPEAKVLFPNGVLTDVKNIEPDLYIVFALALIPAVLCLHYGLVCFTHTHRNHRKGRAATVEEGAAVQEWYNNQGLDLERSVFALKYGNENVRRDGGTYERRMRPSEIRTMEIPEYQALHFPFIRAWENRCAKVVQLFVQSRYPILIEVLNQELQFIQEIDQFKQQLFSQTLAFMVSLGVTAGQLFASYITETYFASEDSEF